MNEQVKDYINKYPSEIIDMYNHLRQIIFDSVPCEPEERLWAKLPSYYIGESVVRLIPFKDHINIVAQAVIQHEEGYRYEQIIENHANLEIFRKKGNYSNKVIYMLHGGAYTQSLKDSHIGMMKAYVDYCGCEVYALDYRVAPKDPYPAALEDAVAGYKVLLNRGWKPEDIIVAGDSAGGGLAMALGLKLKNMGMKIPETFVLSSPWVDLTPREYTKEQRKQDMLEITRMMNHIFHLHMVILRVLPMCM